MFKIPVGLQLFILKEEVQKNYIDTLKKIKGFGYHGVEFALSNYGGYQAKELKKILDSLNLKAVNNHFPLDCMPDNMEPEIEYALEMGMKYLTIPIILPDDRKNNDAYLRTAEVFNKVGEKCKDYGIQTLYHNHGFDFDEIDGYYGIDLLMQNVQPGLVKLELDTHYILEANLDPVNFIKERIDWIELIHLKDNSLEKEYNTDALGEGELDLKGITSLAEDIGIEWLIVDLGEGKRAPLEDVKLSIDNLRNIYN